MNSLVFPIRKRGCFTISTNFPPGFELMKFVGVPVRQKSVEFMCVNWVGANQKLLHWFVDCQAMFFIDVDVKGSV